MGTVLIGYDTESGAVSEASSRPLGIFKKSMEAIKRIHVKLEAPATIFLVGKTLIAGAKYIKGLLDYPDLFDLQQHTYSHVLLKTVIVEDKEKSAYARRPTERYVEGANLEVIREEVRKANNALKEYLDVTCLGIRGPYGYYRGLSDRPDILKILHEEGIRFTSTYLRNQDDWQPVPIDVQPFWYKLQGFPDILEIPGQGWADCIWRDINGWRNRKEYKQYLESTLDAFSRRKLTWGTVFHDWAIIKENPTADTMSEFIQYAKEKGLTVSNYAKFYRQQNDLRHSIRGTRKS